jgi:hypothetical protein
LEYGSIANMVNPKLQKGPTAGSYYPTKPGEHIRFDINDEERKEEHYDTPNVDG